MKFVSYAQNLEDVILWRVLKNYGQGFYIDIGACDPLIESVTKAFYDKGWRGINIEPSQDSFEKIQNDRPRDINLKVALDSQKGHKTFFSVDNGGGLSTFDKEYAQQYKHEGRQVEESIIPTETLADICKTYVNQEIHFLKIDVEGSERAVLQGADLKNYRPWIILLEATRPNTTTPTHSEWESLLLAADYTFVYFDGLNRFYVANEKLTALGDYFSAPPNFFDHYEKHSFCSLGTQLEDIHRHLELTQAKSSPDFHPDTFASQVTATPAYDLHGIVQKFSEIKALASFVDGNFVFLQQDNKKAYEKAAELQLKIETLQIELNTAYQELFESSRYIGWLSKERNNFQNQFKALHATIQQKDQAILRLQETFPMLFKRMVIKVLRYARRVVGYIKRLGVKV